MSNDFNDFMNTPDDTGMYDTQDIQTNKVWAALSYVGILFILPLLVNGGQSRYAKYHANQGFILFLANIVVGIASAILGKIPVLGAVLSALLSLASLARHLFRLGAVILHRTQQDLILTQQQLCAQVCLARAALRISIADGCLAQV